jgi:histidine triad (HIT) family protein
LQNATVSQHFFMNSCIFCDILAGKKPASFIHQDDLCVAFMDIRPINPGHLLVVPRVHAVVLPELDRDSATRLFIVAQHLDAALRESGIKCEGVNLFLADGKAAGQEVMHVHLYIIPRYVGDGHHLRFSPSYYQPTPASKLEAIAEQIRTRDERDRNRAASPLVPAPDAVIIDSSRMEVDEVVAQAEELVRARLRDRDAGGLVE